MFGVRNQKLKFCMSSLIAAGTDYLINYVLLLFGVPMFWATICSKIASSFLNYVINKKAVFQCNEKDTALNSIVRYYVLFAVLALSEAKLAAFAVGLAGNVPDIQKMLIRLPISIALFCVSFIVQKLWVFRKQ